MGEQWTSNLYPIRNMPKNPREAVVPGFLNFTPDVLPRSCTWCGRPMRLVTPKDLSKPVVACVECDYWGFWP